MVLLFLLLFAILAYAILAELEDAPADPASTGTGDCPGCHRPVEEDWLLCPRCRILLKTACGGCGRRIDSWRPFCPWCGRRIEESCACP